MKIIISLILGLFLITGFTASAQKVQSIQFEVSGVCDMCKTRIEKALDTKGVKLASYDVATHTCEVTFSTKKISENEIHQRIANVGHDTDKIKATDEAYSKVHECCKYRTHDNH